MRAFHIDMNTAHFRKDYLEKWLRRFKQYGYDTVLWEVESGVKWQTCPEAALADAFSKKVFREILAYAAELHLTNIPLLQTLGHCEYVLKHAPYKGFRELAEYTDQYCPENKKVSSFLKKWLQEYISVFDQPAVFHIGADEANHLGLCPRCQQYKPYEIYIRHVNRLTSFLTAQGITPAIWGDMILHYPRKLPRLDKRIIIFDWRYERDGSAHFHFWGDRSYYAYKPAAVPSRYKKIFKNYLFKGKKRSADQFYTTSFLTAAGYRTVTCAASSAYGDNVFNPLFPLRVKNAMASLKNDRQKSLDGYLLTSWTVHLFPWELQLPVLAVALYSKQANAFSFSGFKKWFCSYFFHTTDQSFFTALRYLSRVSFYTHTAAIGIDKKGEPVAPDHLLQKVAALKQN
ncbi:MAG TPA: family 20 glycosylhydrolase, partial [Spirochaetota bacterium]|nr:family 20 glycosylhydrolase [Spirochaetota bacterium]